MRRPRVCLPRKGGVDMERFKGVGASDGIVIGPVYPLDVAVAVRETRILAEEIEPELARFERALAAADRQIEGLQQQLRGPPCWTWPSDPGGAPAHAQERRPLRRGETTDPRGAIRGRVGGPPHAGCDSRGLRGPRRSVLSRPGQRRRCGRGPLVARPAGATRTAARRRGACRIRGGGHRSFAARSFPAQAGRRGGPGHRSWRQDLPHGDPGAGVRPPVRRGSEAAVGPGQARRHLAHRRGTWRGDPRTRPGDPANLRAPGRRRARRTCRTCAPCDRSRR